MKNELRGIIAVVVLALLAGGAAGAVITFDKSLDTPGRTFIWDNTSYTITQVGNYKLNEPINVRVTSGTDRMLIVLYDANKISVWDSGTLFNTGGQASVTIPAGKVTTSGTYGIVVSSEGATLGIGPVIISEYDLTVTPIPRQAVSGSIIKATVNVFINGNPSDASGNNIKVELMKGTNTLFDGIAQKTSTGVYEVNIPTSSIPSGDYRLYAAITTGKTIMGYPETLGIADGGTITITQPSSAPPAGSGGVGGGGGGVPSAEDFKNIETKEILEKYISKDVPASYAFRQSNNPVSEIVITSNINAGDITVITEILRSTSSQVNNPPPGVVYKNLNIIVGTSGFAVPKNIKEAVIKFRVNNSWIESNSLEDSDVRMIKWDGSKWIELETTKKDKDSSYTYYEARTNAFSTFAIAALKGESASTAPTAVPSVTPPATPETTGTTVIVITPEELPDITPVLAAGGIVLIAIIAGVYIKRKEIFKK